MQRRGHGTAILNLSGEKGLNLFNEILNAKPNTYNAKKQAKDAKRKLRKQGYYL